MSYVIYAHDSDDLDKHDTCGISPLMRETTIQKQIRGRLNHRNAPTRVFRNNVGMLKDERGIPVTFGLAKGSADLIGIKKVVVTPEMVGTTVGVFLSVEVKTPVGRLSPEQIAWLEFVKSFGGEAIVMRSEDDADDYLGRIAA